MRAISITTSTYRQWRIKSPPAWVAIRRAAGGEIDILREGNFVAFTSTNEAVAEAAAAAAAELAEWDGARDIAPAQQEAAWLKGQPAIENAYGAPLDAAATGQLVEATFSRRDSSVRGWRASALAGVG